MGYLYKPGMGLPVDWFKNDQQQHLPAHGMNNLPTMTVLVGRSAHRGTMLQTMNLLCGNVLEMVAHVRIGRVQSHEWRPAIQRL